MEDERDEQRERPRPRVVDKRVSAGGETTGEAPAPRVEPVPAAEPEPDESAPGPQAGGDAVAAGPGEGEAEREWTPEEEAEARQMAEQIARTPSVEWVTNVAVTLANVAGTKLDLGETDDARLAIDALAALVKEVASQLGEIEGPLKQTVAQLQMAYAAIAEKGTQT